MLPQVKPILKFSAPLDGKRRCRFGLWQWCWGLCLLLLAWCLFLPKAGAQPRCGPPLITSQPMSAIVLAGSNVDFTVAALYEGCAFAYTWRHFGQSLFGGTNSTYTLANAQPFPSCVD